MYSGLASVQLLKSKLSTTVRPAKKPRNHGQYQPALPSTSVESSSKEDIFDALETFHNLQIEQNSSLTYLVPALIDNWFKKQKTTVNMKINKVEKQTFLLTIGSKIVSVHTSWIRHKTL